MKKIFLLCFLSVLIFANDFIVLSGAGYKTPVMKIINSNKSIKPSFANLAQVVQIAKTNDVGVIFGDRKFFKNSGLIFSDEIILGKGILVAIANKEIKNIDDIKNAKKIAIPQSSKAIYGIAAMEFFKNANIYNDIKDKVLEVATVPMVGTYVLNGDVDLGFVNLTEILAKQNDYKYTLEIDEKYYSPIEIAAFKMPSCNDECEVFFESLKDNKTKEIFKQYGLKWDFKSIFTKF